MAASDHSRTLWLVAFAALIYLGLYIALDHLQFAPTRDEKHFWRTSQQLAKLTAPPLSQLELLRSYNELNTPLPFIVFGAVEHFTNGGIAAGRLVNLIISFIIVMLIIINGSQRARANQQPPWQVALACAGLLAFPYFLGTSVMLYTDIIPAAFVLAGMILHTRGKPWLATIMCVLAISSRQYAVAFPIALAVYEFCKAAMRAKHAHVTESRSEEFPWLKPGLFQLQRTSGISMWLAPMLAATSLLGWIAFFGGLAPRAAIDNQSLASADALRIFPAHTLYFLACIGAYFVIPEVILFRRINPLLSAMRARRGLVIAAGIVIAFILWPPLRNVDYGVPSMGYLDKAARLVLGDVLRMMLLAALALLAVFRFRTFNLATLLVWTNALIMMKAHIGWDKYALPLLVVLWWMKAIDALHATELPRTTQQRLPCPHDEVPAMQRESLLRVGVHRIGPQPN